MALAYQARAMRKGLAKLGESSTLGGIACGKVSIDFNVEAFPGINSYADDNSSARYNVATIDRFFSPKVGGVLIHPVGRYKLDRLLDDNGIVRRFIIVAI